MKALFSSKAQSVLFMVAIMSLGGCTTFAEDGGFNSVSQIAKEHTGKELKWIRSASDQQAIDNQIAELLKLPLSVYDAVQIGLLNNKGLQAKYAALSISEADLVEAGHILNPTFSFARLKRGDEIEVERLFMLPIFRLLTMSSNIKIERNRFEQTQLSIATDVLNFAHDVRHTYFSTLAAQETVKYMEQVKTSAEAGALLAKEMAKVGNWSKLQQSQEQVFHAEALTQYARARQNFNSNRERLYKLLGLSGANSHIILPERLPDLPDRPREIKDVETLALKDRLDIQISQKKLTNLADSLGLTKATSFIDLLDVGYQHNSETGKPRQTGYELELRVPLFDWGHAHIAKSEAIYMQAVNQAAELSVNARSEVREGYFNYRNAYDLAKHYRDEVVPLKKQISDEMLLRYNGMLVSVFDLLADARSQYISVNASIEALRDYWIADSTLQIALIGSPSGNLNVQNMTVGTSSNNAGH